MGMSYDMTTDPEEGRRQIEAMQPPQLKVGDKVRLKAGGEHVMTVVAVYDYGNKVDCAWTETTKHGDLFPASALVRVE
jgi:uncharacterized protein YodC (DUF2158 family)